MAQLHLIMGKGGVGRSTYAAALARHLGKTNTGPVLLMEVQGTGRSLQLCGWQGAPPFDPSPLPDAPGVWGCRILPHETFRQYFSMLLALGKETSTFGQVTSGVRDRLVDLVLANRVVSAFVDVCPGIEPAVLAGKIHWEASTGSPPETKTRWAHVVVDCPATGHGLMMFRSTNALRDVFPVGVVHKQATSIMDFIRDPKQTRVRIVTLPEELPVRESLDLTAGLAKMGIGVEAFVVNRCAPPPAGTSPASAVPAPWDREAAFELEAAQTQKRLVELLRTEAPASARLEQLPETPTSAPSELAARLEPLVGGDA